MLLAKKQQQTKKNLSISHYPSAAYFIAAQKVFQQKRMKTPLELMQESGEVKLKTENDENKVSETQMQIEQNVELLLDIDEIWHKQNKEKI